MVRRNRSSYNPTHCHECGEIMYPDPKVAKNICPRCGGGYWAFERRVWTWRKLENTTISE